MIDNSVAYLLLGIGLVILLVAAGTLYVIRQSSKEANANIPPEIVGRILDHADSLAEMLLPLVAKTETTTDDDLDLFYLKSRGFDVTGSPETGYTATKPPVLPAS